MKRSIISSLLLSVIALSSAKKTILVDFTKNENQNLESVQMYKTDDLSVKFNENPSTGFVWSIYKADDNSTESTLDTEISTYTPPTDPMAGQKGVREFNFTAINPGHENYQFVNARRWEISNYLKEDGSFNTEQAEKEGAMFTLVNLHVNVDYLPTFLQE